MVKEASLASRSHEKKDYFANEDLLSSEEILLEVWRAGGSVSGAARALGHTYSNIQNRIKIRGLQPKVDKIRARWSTFFRLSDNEEDDEQESGTAPREAQSACAR